METGGGTIQLLDHGTCLHCIGYWNCLQILSSKDENDFGLRREFTSYLMQHCCQG